MTFRKRRNWCNLGEVSIDWHEQCLFHKKTALSLLPVYTCHSVLCIPCLSHKSSVTAGSRWRDWPGLSPVTGPLSPPPAILVARTASGLSGIRGRRCGCNVGRGFYSSAAPFTMEPVPTAASQPAGNQPAGDDKGSEIHSLIASSLTALSAFRPAGNTHFIATMKLRIAQYHPPSPHRGCCPGAESPSRPQPWQMRPFEGLAGLLTVAPQAPLPSGVWP